MTTYANRGRQLERAINELFKRYKALSIPCGQIFPRSLHDGTITGKAPFDFWALYQGRMRAFDAKMCEQASWNVLTNAKVHQVKALTDIGAQGGEGFFLVLFVRSRQLVRFDVPFLYPDLKSLKPIHGQVILGLDFLNVLQITR